MTSACSHKINICGAEKRSKASLLSTEQAKIWFVFWVFYQFVCYSARSFW